MPITFEGFTLNAIVEGEVEIVGRPLADDRFESRSSHELPPAVSAAFRAVEGGRA
jgi:hypothetical protein